MISIDRLEEMAIEELKTKLNNWKEQVELQSNFIDSLLKATNNSEWLDKTILDDEASEIIEKIELDYVQLDKLKEQLEAYKMEADEGKEINAELKAENDELKRQHEGDKGLITSTGKQNYQLIQEYDKLKNCLTEIKEIARVNPINTCWTVLELCEKCDENKECDIQCPLFKFKLILQKISECEVE